jgi:hypothetical protein
VGRPLGDPPRSCSQDLERYAHPLRLAPGYLSWVLHLSCAGVCWLQRTAPQPVASIELNWRKCRAARLTPAQEWWRPILPGIRPFGPSYVDARWTDYLAPVYLEPGKLELHPCSTQHATLWLSRGIRIRTGRPIDANEHQARDASASRRRLTNSATATRVVQATGTIVASMLTLAATACGSATSNPAQCIGIAVSS